MNIQPQQHTHQSGFNSQKQPQFNKQVSWEQRKILLIKVNPNIQKLFEKIDFDYSEMFKELGIFEGEYKQPFSKQIFLQKNYEKILIHFFQFLFDYQLQTLKFKEKHETILSFADWIQSEITFQYPDILKLLHKKKYSLQSNRNISEKKHSLEQKIQINFKNVSKRNFEDRMEQMSIEKQIQCVSSPKKVKIAEEEQFEFKFMDFSYKYDDSTNHTIEVLPKSKFSRNEEEKQKIDKKQNDLQSQNNNKNISVKKKGSKFFNKVQQTTTTENLFKNRKKSQKKDTLTQNKERTHEDLVQNLTLQEYLPKQCSVQKKKQKKITQHKQDGKSNNSKQKIKINDSKEQEQQELIQLEQKSQQIAIPNNQPQENINACQQFINDLQISGLNLYDPDFELKSDVSKVGSICSQDSYINFQQIHEPIIEERKHNFLSVNNSIEENNLGRRPKSQESINTENARLSKVKIEQIMKSIGKDQRTKSSLQIEKQYQENRIKRQLYSIRARLSGIFHYSEKRFYIFPEMQSKSYWEEENDKKYQTKFKARTREKPIKVQSKVLMSG